MISKPAKINARSVHSNESKDLQVYNIIHAGDIIYHMIQHRLTEIVRFISKFSRIVQLHGLHNLQKINEIKKNIDLTHI